MPLMQQSYGENGFPSLITILKLWGLLLITKKKSMLLLSAGSKIYELYDTLPEADTRDYNKCRDSLTAYFAPKCSLSHSKYLFRTAMQLQTESVDAYITRLRILAKTCQFHDVEDEIKQQLIAFGTCGKLRRRALKSEMTLTELQQYARSLELSETHAKDMERGMTQLQVCNKLHTDTSTIPETGKSRSCYRCGRSYPHSGDCPATGKICTACGKINHFSSVCKSKEIKSTPRQSSQKFKSRRKTVRCVDQHYDSTVDLPAESSDNDDKSEGFIYMIHQVGKNKVHQKKSGAAEVGLL
ncbi:uncharacterized protein LOC134911236 [Pseudophryne corroboree]|uniref:uncharacterized protein LOC134911236 n=1 Tax=Pseudophryne corroboree TaxID=495146 RepID=UPI0030815090